MTQFEKFVPIQMILRLLSRLRSTASLIYVIIFFDVERSRNVNVQELVQM